MKIFITGGTGFIGKQLVRILKDTVHELYCLTRKESHIEALKGSGATLVEGDVLDLSSLIKGMQGCDWVVNLANFYEFWTRDRSRYWDVNVAGTQNVMEAAITSHIAKVVHISTVAVFGNAELPVTEDSAFGDHCVTEYAQSKRAGELKAWELAEKKHLPLIVIYPSAVLGPDDPKASGRYIKNMVRGKMPAQVLCDSGFSFVYVKDVAQVIIKALEKDNNIGEKYIVSAENHTWSEINQMIGEISGTKPPFLKLPTWMTVMNAYLLTGLANIIRKPPLWDLAVDQIALMKQGFRVDGSKVERELGLTYTPLKTAISEAIESFV